MRLLMAMTVALLAVGCGPQETTVGDACRTLLPALRDRLVACEGSTSMATLGCQGAQCANQVEPAAVASCLEVVQSMRCEVLAARPPIVCFKAFRCSAD